jgi:hypothetical protein
VTLPPAAQVVGARPGAADPVPLSLVRHLEAERVRLRAHFDSVLVELVSRDVSHLTAAQRSARTELTTWLREYRDAGEFPLNEFSAATVPIFRDRRGVLCAMAYLIDRSGRSDLVDHVERTRNTAYVAELVDEDGLVAWLDSTGLAIGEAAMIQPTYSSGDRQFVDPGAAARAVILSGGSAAAATWSLLKPSPVSGWIGVMAGAVTVFDAASGRYTIARESIFEPNDLEISRGRDATLQSLGFITGAAAVGFGVRAILQSRPQGTQTSDRRTMIAIAPGLGARGPGIAVAMRHRF